MQYGCGKSLELMNMAWLNRCKQMYLHFRNIWIQFVLSGLITVLPQYILDMFISGFICDKGTVK